MAYIYVSSAIAIAAEVLSNHQMQWGMLIVTDHYCSHYAFIAFKQSANQI